MNPDTTQQELDPSVVALTKAIGQAESGGNYNAPSKDPGSLPSAYQFTPDFLDNWGPKILGKNYKSGTQLSPAQQDELAYGVVKTLGSEGDPAYPEYGKLTPPQIASAWNAGDPSAYLDPNYGKNNNYGSVENYVNTVGKYYEQNRQSTPQTPQSTQVPQQSEQKPPGLLDSILNSGIFGLGGVSSLSPLGGIMPALAGNAINWAVQNPKASLPLAGAAIGGFIDPAGGEIPGGYVGEKLAGLLGGNQPPIQGQETPTQPSSDTNALLQELQQTSQSSRQLSDTYSSALQGTIKGRNMINDPAVKNAIDTASTFGLAPQIDENGSMNFQPALDKSNKLVGDMSSKIQDALLAEKEIAPLSFAVQEAKKQLHKTTPSNEWAEGEAEIEKQAATYQKNFGDKQGNMPLAYFEQMKREQGHGKKWNILETSAKKQAGKALARGAKNTILKHTKHKDLYSRVMKVESGLIEARKVMKHLNGKKAKKNESMLKNLLHSGGKYAALYVGDKIGGPLGAILATMIGEHITKAVDKKFGKSIFETPAMQKSLEHLQHGNPAMYRIMLRELEKAGISYPKKKFSKKPINLVQSSKATQTRTQSKGSPKSQSSPSKSRKSQGLPLKPRR